MQTHRQNSIEVGIGFGLSLFVNIVAQMMFYGQLTMAPRSLSVAFFVLGSSLPRRYGTRRVFNGMAPTASRQPRWHSWLEVGVDTVIGFFVAVVVQWIFYGGGGHLGKGRGTYRCGLCRYHVPAAFLLAAVYRFVYALDNPRIAVAEALQIGSHTGPTLTDCYRQS